MVKILIGSSNPTKIEATREAFSKYFDYVETEVLIVDSKVSNQPVNFETFEGAKNRVMELRRLNQEQNHNADYFVGIEGGIIKLYHRWFSVGAVYIMDKHDRVGVGTSPMHELPESITSRLLEDGIELGKVIDELSGNSDTKKKTGTVGYLTNGLFTRKDFYTPGLMLAMIPFLQEKLFFKEEAKVP